MDCLSSCGLLCTRSRADGGGGMARQAELLAQKRARNRVGGAPGDVRRLLSSPVRACTRRGPRPHAYGRSPEGRGCSGSAQADPAKGNWRCFCRDRLLLLQMTILSEIALRFFYYHER
jgi:hypothetical protein